MADLEDALRPAADDRVGDRAVSLLAGQRQVLERIIAGQPLPVVLDGLLRMVEERSGDGVIGSILLLDEDGTHLRHGAAPQLPADYVAAIDGVAIGPAVGSCGTAAYRREQVVVEDIATDPLWEDFRHLALGAGLRACWSTPILAGDGELLGTFAMYYRVPRRPSPDDLEVIDLLVRTSAIAIGRARADRERDRALADLNFVLDTTTKVAATLDREGTLAVLAETAVPTLADICMIDLAEEGSIRRAAVAANRGVDCAIVERLAQFPPDPDGTHPAARVLASGKPEFAVELSDEFLRSTCRDGEHFLAVRSLGFDSFMTVPLAARGRVFGAMTLVSSGSGRRYGERDLAVAQDLAGRVALAIDNIALYQSAREAERRVALVARAGAALTSSLDVHTVAERLGELLNREVGDVCEVHVARPDGQWLRQTFTAGQPGPPVLVDALPGEVARVVTSRGPALFGDRLGGVLASPPPAGGRWASAAVVPLAARGHTVGVLTVGSATDTSAQELVDIVQVISGRAALALDNALLFEQERTAAEVLQRSLLPQHLPVVAGMRTAVRYEPAGPRTEVGGDWFDVLPFGDDRVGVVMGDVMGRGIPAASVMGQLRNGLRMLALQRLQPGEALSLLNRLIGSETASSFATVLYGVIDLSDRSFTFANAGHCPPLRLRRGVADYLELPPGIPLGCFPDSDYAHHAVELAPGDVLVLYTDGLIEQRDRSIDDGLEALARAATSGAGTDPEGLCDHLLAVLKTPDGSEDDTAILAIELQPG